MICEKRIDHRHHGHEGKQPGGDAAHAVAKVEQADGQPAEDDGEVEPGEEGALVGEEDFGLDAGGEEDAFACGGGKRGLGLVWRGLVVGEGGRGVGKKVFAPGAAWRRGWLDMMGGG